MQLLLQHNYLCKLIKVTRLLLIIMFLVLVQVVQVSATSYAETMDMKENKSVMQQIGITGTVTDSDGQTLPGVTVKIKDASQGTATDADGVYSLQVSNENAVLVFSYIQNS